MNTEKLHKELTFRTSRSSGSGGQHVNKVETRVELLFDVNMSQELDVQQKTKIWEKLENRINKEGILIVSSQASRSQLKNKKTAIKKFDELIEKALSKKKKKKRKAKPFVANKKKRLKAKKKHAEKKALRKKVVPGDVNNLF